ncbi:TPA: DUF5623 domain-containing protein [Pseudomonas aeruginosa]|nr:DUF5623 domain-containing protein [Pseudomonas aeruginosa]HCA5866805.1 DUF5623 domain-containing protein [Pseudomonas aeruginosa]HCA7379992.1 DUF5623 domain-containing protein [Pseudomonas aeruginosa]HCA7775041.1 DUF5623 domain-containing protein [Pseudomonas aeruginosa]
MVTEHTRPTTLAGVKRLAKFIKRARGIPHHAALDEAAQKAGFQNLRHAQSVLGESARDLHQAFVTFYWQECAGFPAPMECGPVLRSGRTTLKLLLPAPLKDLLPGRSLNRTPYIDDFRLEAADHLELRSDYYSEHGGMKMAKQVALALNFMAATGLRAPLASEMPRRDLNLSDNADHCSYWYDEKSKCIVILDEPYQPLFEDEIAWGKDHGFHTVGVRWRGIYLAGATPRLHSVSEVTLPCLVDKLEALEARLEDENWTYDSQAYGSRFISPARALSGKQVAPRIMPTLLGVERAGAVPWETGQPGHRSRWRPARRMDLDKHLHIGPIMSSLSVSVTMAWSGARLGQIGSTLGAWFRSEYEDAELPNKQSRQVYDLPKPTFISGTANQLTALADVRQTIVEGYQDCKPKMDLLERIDRADRWIRRNIARQEPMESDISSRQLAALRRRDGSAQ